MWVKHGWHKASGTEAATLRRFSRICGKWVICFRKAGGIGL